MDARAESQLAIVLACGHHDHSAPTFGGKVSPEPLTSGLGNMSRPHDYPRSPGIPIPKSVIPELEKYSSCVATTDPDSPLAFAGRRLLRSLNADNSQDSLVDAVVVWEAIFSVSPETAFRVTASVASTLRNDFKDHLPLAEFQKILNDIYDARSQIVHGDAAKVKKRRARHYDDARNARRYSRRLLRYAFLWPERIKRLDSGARSKQAILGDWPPSELPDHLAPEE